MTSGHAAGPLQCGRPDLYRGFLSVALESTVCHHSQPRLRRKLYGIVVIANLHHRRLEVRVLYSVANAIFGRREGLEDFEVHRTLKFELAGRLNHLTRSQWKWSSLAPTH